MKIKNIFRTAIICVVIPIFSTSATAEKTLFPSTRLLEGKVDTTIKSSGNGFDGRMRLKGQITDSIRIDSAYIEQDIVVKPKGTSFRWLGNDTNAILFRAEMSDEKLLLTAADPLSLLRRMEIGVDGFSATLNNGKSGDSLFTGFDIWLTKMEKNGEDVKITIRVEPAINPGGKAVSFKKPLRFPMDYPAFCIDLDSAKAVVNNYLEIFSKETMHLKNNSGDWVDTRPCVVVRATNNYKYPNPDTSIHKEKTDFFRFAKASPLPNQEGYLRRFYELVLELGLEKSGSTYKQPKFYFKADKILGSYYHDFSPALYFIHIGDPALEKPTNVFGPPTINGIGYQQFVLRQGEYLRQDGHAIDFYFQNGGPPALYKNSIAYVTMRSGDIYSVDGLTPDTTVPYNLRARVIRSDSAVIEDWNPQALSNKEYGTKMAGAHYPMSADTLNDTTSVVEAGAAPGAFRAYPNPAKTKIIIVSDIIIGKVNIFNTLGIQVWSGEFKDTKAEIDVENFAAGIYFIKVDNKVNMFVKE